MEKLGSGMRSGEVSEEYRCFLPGQRKLYIYFYHLCGYSKLFLRRAAQIIWYSSHLFAGYGLYSVCRPLQNYLYGIQQFARCLRFDSIV